MAVTTLDPNTALIIVDLQKGIVGSSFIDPIDGIVSRSRARLVRLAREHGFNVTLSLDAMTDARPEAHDYSIKNVFPKLGETGTAQDIIDLLATRSV